MSQFFSPQFFMGVALLLMCADYFTGAMQSAIGRVRMFNAALAGLLLLCGLVSLTVATGVMPTSSAGYPLWLGVIQTLVGAALLIYQLSARQKSNWKLGWKYSCVVYAALMLCGVAMLMR